MRHCERVDDALPQFLNDIVQPANVIKRHGYLSGRDDFHSDRLLVRVKLEVFDGILPLAALSSSSVIIFIVSVGVVAVPLVLVIRRFSVMVGEDTLQA